MNKQELIDKAVELHQGKLPSTRLDEANLSPDSYPYFFKDNDYKEIFVADGACDSRYLCSIDAYLQRARELGFCKGYKYGVVYETNGKKPDLPDDIEVEFKHKKYGWNSDFDGIISCKSSCWDWSKSSAFRIVDERYKPVETAAEKSWHEKGELPPVGVECEYKHKNAQPDWARPDFCRTTPIFFGNKLVVFRDENGQETVGSHADYEFRPLKTERERFVDVVTSLAVKNDITSPEDLAGALYDSGFKAPE